MQISPTSAYTAFLQPSFPSRPNKSATQADPAATFAARISISQSARDRLAAHSDSSSATALFETDQGAKELDIDAYFSPPANASASAGLNSLPPLLLPNPKNIDALSRHISAALPGFLAKNNIPYPPASITYDNAGKMQLPADYPYATEFEQALKDAPALDRELHAVNALTSHLVEMRKVMPFQEEYAAAGSQAEADAVVAKYSYLFSGNRHYDTIALNFSKEGVLSLTADGKPVALA